MWLLAATAGARFLGPLLQGPLVKAHCVPSLQLQLLGLGLLVPVLAADVMSPAAFNALPEPLHHGAVFGNAAAPVSTAAAMSSIVAGRRPVGSAVHADPGPAETAAQVIVKTNAAAVGGDSGGWKIPHPFPRAHYFGRTFFPLPFYTRAPHSWQKRRRRGNPPFGILSSWPWKR